MGTIDSTGIKESLSVQPALKAWLFGVYALIQYDDNARIGLLRHADLIISPDKILNRSVNLVTEGSLLSWIRPYIEKQNKYIMSILRIYHFYCHNYNPILQYLSTINYNQRTWL